MVTISKLHFSHYSRALSNYREIYVDKNQLPLHNRIPKYESILNFNSFVYSNACFARSPYFSKPWKPVSPADLIVISRTAPSWLNASSTATTRTHTCDAFLGCYTTCHTLLDIDDGHCECCCRQRYALFV